MTKNIDDLLQESKQVLAQLNADDNTPGSIKWYKRAGEDAEDITYYRNLLDWHSSKEEPIPEHIQLVLEAIDEEISRLSSTGRTVAS